MMNLQGEARSGPSRPSGAPLPTGGRADEASADVGAHGRAPVAGTSSPVLRICLFGPLRVCMGERVLIDEHFARWKARALFVYLYLNRGHHVAKDEALEALWPGAAQNGAGRLKQAVLTLRSAIEPHPAGTRPAGAAWRYIREKGGFYYFNAEAEYTSDAEEFERELALAGECRQRGDSDGALVHYRRTLGLRRGPFLHEFRQEHWAATESARLQELYLEALGDTARLYASRHELAPAIRLLRAALNEDSLYESAYLDLMQVLWLDGRHVEALRVYHRLREVLATHLQIEPEPRATRLYEAIRRDRAAAGTLPPEDAREHR